ncbi:MAG: hypothetical protein ACYCXI_08610 [Dethiobacteraceae bacterium]
MPAEAHFYLSDGAASGMGIYLKIASTVSLGGFETRPYMVRARA